MEFDPTEHPHRRLNPLTGEHVLVSPHRANRPWLGQIEQDDQTKLPHHDPKCHLCPGNTRVGGEQNPNYDSTFAFHNDFSAVLPAPAPAAPTPAHPLLTSEPVHGGCDVLIFHPRHDLTLPRLSVADIEKIIHHWISIYKRRGSQEGIAYVQIFENKGAIMGCSNPHPHGQVWSLSSIPTLPATELGSLTKYSFSEVATASDAPRGPKNRPCLLCDYVTAELKLGDRVVIKNEHWVALVPCLSMSDTASVLPYKRHVPSLVSLTSEEKTSFAEITLRLTKRYDNLFKTSFAYSMGIHQRPTPPPEDSMTEEGEDEDNVAHLHLHFDPPLLRSATVRKFLVGFELMAEAQRDLSPEQAAERLRDLPEAHFQDVEQ